MPILLNLARKIYYLNMNIFKIKLPRSLPGKPLPMLKKGGFEGDLILTLKKPCEEIIKNRYL